MKNIVTLLREKTGLNCGALGQNTVERIVRRRMDLLGLTRLAEYYDRLLTSESEYGELLEGVIVGETWFFRNPESLTALARIALQEWLPRHPAKKLHVLSIPCASGEEAYSIAMALLDAGFPADRFQVDAIDISTRALDYAQRAIYGKNAFRGQDLSFRDRYFRPMRGGFALQPNVQRQVYFAKANLLGHGFITAQPAYHYIFFRNLLIYLDSTAQKVALGKIERLLADDGMLFIGTAEQQLVVDFGFESAELPKAFACRRHLARDFYSRQAGPGPITNDSGALLSVPAASNIGDLDLAKAQQLADAGKLAEAASICEAYLRRTQSSAQAHYLLGLVRDARGDVRAGDSYRKALYLEPNHYEALVHLACLADKMGDAASAQQFQRRAQRLELDRSLDL